MTIREALQLIHDKVNSLDEECGVDSVEIRDIARAALNEHQANCECDSNTKKKILELAFKHHFKYDPQRGICMTQCGGRTHYRLSTYHSSVQKSIVDCLNEVYNDYCFNKMKPETLKSFKDLLSKLENQK